MKRIAALAMAMTLAPIFIAGADDCEPNDTLETAVLLAPLPCVKVAGEIDPAGDTDYFRIEADAGDLIWISTVVDGEDTVIGLYGADGSLIESDDDDGAGLGSLIAGAELTDAGSYYIMVYEYGNNDAITYDLYVTLFNESDFAEETSGSNESHSQAQVIGLDRFVSGTFSTYSDADWYMFTSTFPGDLLVFQLDDDPGRTGTGGFDSVLELYSSDGTTLLEDGDHEGTGPDEPEDLIYENTTIGRRYLRAGSDTNPGSFSPGTYYLAMALAEEHVCTTPTPSPSPEGPTPSPTSSTMPTISPLPTASPVPSPSAPPAPFRIAILPGRYKPPRVRVDPGQPVIWTNETGLAHTVTAEDDSWYSGILGVKDRYIHTFSVEGPHPYYCRVSPAPMTGVIICGWATPTPLIPTPTTTPNTSPTVSPAATSTPAPTATPPPPWIYDYDGNGDSDIAIFRGSSGLWAIRGITRAYFGSSTDTVVPGDYDGDGTTEIAIFRPSSGLWAVRGVTRAYFGTSGDHPLPGDYDGDGETDIAVFRDSSGLWAARGVTRVYFGSPSDAPVPGYYDSDGTADIGIFRGSTGLWAIRGVTRVYFGTSTDTVVPGDYRGDGGWEIAVFRPASGLWAVRGFSRVYFGSATDLPVPGGYSGGGEDAPAVFRESSGLWAVRGVTRVYFGTTGDEPVTR